MKNQTTKLNHPIRVDHMNMTVKDLDQSVEWYGNVFGFYLVEKGNYSGRRWTILRSGEFMLCLYQSPNAEPKKISFGDYPRVSHFGFRITNREVWEKIMIEQAIPLRPDEPIRYPHSWSWYVLDPSGYEIEVTLWDNDQILFNEPA